MATESSRPAEATGSASSSAELAGCVGKAVLGLAIALCLLAVLLGVFFSAIATRQ